MIIEVIIPKKERMYIGRPLVFAGLRNCLLLVSLFFSLGCSSQVDSSCIKVNIGDDVNTIYDLYNHSEIRIVDLFIEAFYTPALRYESINSEGYIDFEIDCNSISRIWVYSKECQFSKEIGVGSSFGELKNNYEISWIDKGEAGSVAYVESLKMSFIFDYYEDNEISETAIIKCVLISD